MTHFLEELWGFLIRHERELPSLLTGAAAGVFLALVLGRIYNRSRRVAMRLENVKLKGIVQQQGQTISEQSRRVDDLNRDSHESRERLGKSAGLVDSKSALIDGLTTDNERLKEESIRLVRRIKSLRRRLREATDETEELSGRLDKLKDSDGKIWTRRTLSDPPAFVPLAIRQTPVLSVLNLKGGVGKTTITANLGAALAAQGRRILLIDLDFQGSLTAKCIGSTEDYEDARRSRRLIEDALSGEGGLRGFDRSMIRVRDLLPGDLHILGADDKFADFETMLMGLWLSGSAGDDIRYRLRRVLHHPSVADRFDLVLLDCPPRLSTGCVNALASSDYLLVPVLPEKDSTDAVPRLLTWFKELRPHVCPDLKLLGVLGNKAKYLKTRLVSRQQVILRSMIQECEKSWGGTVHNFTPMKIHDVDSRFAALDPKYKPAYLDLVDEILKEMSTHAHRRNPAIPAVAR